MGGAEGCWATVSKVMAILCPQHHSQHLSHHGLRASPLAFSAYFVTTGPLHEPFMPLPAASHPSPLAPPPLLLSPVPTGRQKLYLCGCSQVTWHVP